MGFEDTLIMVCGAVNQEEIQGKKTLDEPRALPGECHGVYGIPYPICGCPSISLHV